MHLNRQTDMYTRSQIVSRQIVRSMIIRWKRDVYCDNMWWHGKLVMYSVATYIPNRVKSSSATSVTSGELRLCAARRRKIVRPNIAIITHTGNRAGGQSCYEGSKST